MCNVSNIFKLLHFQREFISRKISRNKNESSRNSRGGFSRWGSDWLKETANKILVENLFELERTFSKRKAIMDLGCRMINQIAELVDNPNTRFDQLMTLHRKIYNLEIIPRRPEPCPLRRQNMTSVRRIGSSKNLIFRRTAGTNNVI